MRWRGAVKGKPGGVVEICALAKGRELIALRCLEKVAANKNMHQPWSRIQEPLVCFLETMTELGEDVRSEGEEVADLYGRNYPDKFRTVRKRLRRKNEGG
jgi:hypothetical protein